MIRRSVWVVVAGVLALGLGGCGREKRPVAGPACQGGPDSVLRALKTAPRPVSLEGETLSGCIRDSIASSDLMSVGSSFLEAAQRLGDRAEGGRDPAAATQLGYLIGAMNRGRVEEQGVSAELVRRVADEAQRVGADSAAFRRGERAGRRSG